MKRNLFLSLLTLSLFSGLFLNQSKYNINNKNSEERINEYLDVAYETQENNSLNNEYVSWGADYIGVNDYSNYLEDTYGVENLPEVIVAVIDTGVNTNHSWFEGRVAEGGANFSSSPDGEELVYEDKRGHGTHVAGTIMDIATDNVKVLPIKVLNNYGGISSEMDIINGFEYVYDLKLQGHNIQVVNASLGDVVDPSYYELYADVIKRLRDVGVHVVVSAGNSKIDTANWIPANVPEAITVSGAGVHQIEYIDDVRTVTITDPTGFATYYSNYGDAVDIIAPGTRILSANYEDEDGGTLYKNGTSMAAPHVSAAISLLYSDPSKNYSVSDVENILDILALDLGDSGWDKYYGMGLLNIENAQAVDIVKFDTVEGCYDPFELTLSNNFAGASIYYTTDGSIPTLTNGTLYTGPIKIEESQVVNAIVSYKIDGETVVLSNVSSASYIINNLDSEELFEVDANGKLIAYNGEAKNLIVPSVINGITITSIGSNAFSNAPVETLSLPNTVTIIESEAFNNHSTLSYINAPGVVRIKEYAFNGCESLQIVDAPSVETIEAFAFVNCSKLEEIDLTNVKVLGSVIDEVTSNGYVFKGCTSLKSVSIPNVEYIYQASFDTTLEEAFVGNKLKNYYNGMISSETKIYGYSNSLIYTYSTINNNEFIPIDLTIIKDLDDNYKVEKNEKYILNIDVQGYGLSYQWYEIKNNNTSVIVGETSSSLMIDTSSIGNTQYYVEIIDINNETIESNICTVEVTKNYYAITVKTIGNGSIDKGNYIIVGEDETKYLTIIPKEGWYIESITINSVPQEISNVITITKLVSDTTVNVIFKQYTYDIEVKTEGEGNVTTTSNLIDVAYGTALEFEATPKEGWYIESITINEVTYELTEDINTELSYNIDISKLANDIIMKVIFKQCTYDVLINISGEGIIESDFDLTNKLYGERISIDIIPNKGWHLEKAYIDDELVSVINNVIDIDGINGDIKIELFFEKIPNETPIVPIILGSGLSLTVIGLVVFIIIKKRKNK